MIKTDSHTAFRAKQAAAFLAVYVIWGSTYLAIRFAIESLPGFLMAGGRFLTAGALLYFWARLRGAPNPTLAQWRSAFIIGGLLLLCGNGSVVWAEQHIPSGLAALLVGTEPLWIVVLLWVWPSGERPKLRTVFGLILGFCGAALLAVPEEGLAGGSMHTLAIAAMLFACITWAAGSLYARTSEAPKSPIMNTASQMLAGGFLLLIVSSLLGEPFSFNPAQTTPNSWFALLYLIVFGSIIAFSAYSWLVRTTAPTLVATYAYVNPVVAVFLGWLLANEPVTWKTIAASVLIISAVLIVSLAERKPRKPKGRPQTEDAVPMLPKPPAALQTANVPLDRCA